MSASSRRRFVVATGLALLLLAFVLVWFQPHKLFLDERVDEALPAAVTASIPPPVAVADPASVAPSTTVPGPIDLVTGTFVSLDHATEGTARVLELGAGQRVLRIEGLDTSNGPDVHVYLTASPADGAESAFDDDFVHLGGLKGNQGDQNYEVPAGTDLARYPTVVIWCDRFDSAFGAADLA